MSNYSTVCVDANLIVKLLNPSTAPSVLPIWDRWLAEELEIVAPLLLRYEVTNAFYQMLRHHVIDKADAAFAIRTTIALPITTVHEAIIHQEALEIASRLKISATYDAHYLALAEYLGCEFWTSDKRLYNAVQHQLSWVHFLEIEPS